VSLSINRIDDANIELKGEISQQEIDERVNQLAKKASKDVQVDGFRKGKVPLSIIKKLYGKQLQTDAESEILDELLNKSLDEIDIKRESLIGEPIFEEYEKLSDKTEFKINVSILPKIEINGYKDLIPKYDMPEITSENVEEDIHTFAMEQSIEKDTTEDRELRDGDIAIIDFEGFLDGEPFEGAKANDYELEIGSNQFVGDFEKQLIGMKKGESKEIKVNLSKDEYLSSEKLKISSARFNVTLKDIKEIVLPTINDEYLKEVFSDEDITLEKFKNDIKLKLIKDELISMYYNELKDKLLENLINKFDFPLPKNIVEQEIDNRVNQKAKELSEDELKAIQGDEKIEELSGACQRRCYG